MKIKLSVLGSTGSIGRSTFDIVNKKKNSFKINLLCANKNYNLICKQIKNYRPNFFVISNKSIYEKVKKRFKKSKKIFFNNFNRIYKTKSDITISAIPGIAGLSPTLKMIKHSKKILIANKESIICGWSLIQKNSKKYKTQIIPIDSEHYSIFKLLESHRIQEIKRI